MSFHKSLLASTFLIAMVSLCACQHGQEGSDLPIKQYQLHGRVVRLNPQNHTAVINGQKIEGWMEAMTVEYLVKTDGEYQKLRPGEQISATVFVQGIHFWIGGLPSVSCSVVPPRHEYSSRRLFSTLLAEQVLVRRANERPC